MSLSDQDVSRLRMLLGAIKADAKLLEHPKLSFFKQWLLSLGAKLPEAPKPEKPESDDDMPDLEDDMPEAERIPKPAPAAAEESESEPESSELSESPAEEEEHKGEWEEDTVDEEALTVPTGQPDELTEEQDDQLFDLRDKARTAAADQKFDAAVAHLKEAMVLEVTAGLVCQRAQLLYKQKKARACIFDCNQALKINDSYAKAFKFRGRAHRQLGEFEEAFRDLSKANACDYDPEVYAEIKQLQKYVDEAHARTKVRLAYKKKRDQKRLRKLMRERKKQAKKQAREQAEEEAHRNAANAAHMGAGGMGGMPGGMGGMPGGMGGMPGGMGDMMNDPDIKEALSDPEVMAELQKVMSNPAALASCKNPKVQRLIAKMGMFGKGGAGGMPGGMPGGMGGMPGMGGMGGMPGMGGMGGGCGGCPGGSCGGKPCGGGGADDLD